MMVEKMPHSRAPETRKGEKKEPGGEIAGEKGNFGAV